MKDVRDYITLAIHTPSRAQYIHKLLQTNGVDSKLEDFISFQSPVTVAIRVKIRAKDLPISLRLIENIDFTKIDIREDNMTGMGGELLIPVDFSCGAVPIGVLGLNLAARLNLKPVFIHAVNYSGRNIGIQEYNSNKNEDNLSQIDYKTIELLNNFKRTIKNKQKSGEANNIKFSTILRTGVPEEVILEYVKNNSPSLLLLATRSIDQKAKDLTGSVVAEVIDSCRVPCLIFPENAIISDFDKLERLLFFCTLSQLDFISMEVFLRMFSYPACHVKIIPDLSIKNVQQKNVLSLENINQYFANNYLKSNFEFAYPNTQNLKDFVDTEIQNSDIQMLIFPNRRRNVFNRFFKPTLAHKNLFERDVPSFVIPI